MHVLVCDDDPAVGAYFATLFDLEGWSTTSVTSGQHCLSVFAEGASPDVLVLDQMMPGMKGTEVAEAVRGQGFDRPIILCSAFLGAEHRADIDRLDLLPVNKVDAPALVRLARAALDARAGAPAPPAPA